MTKEQKKAREEFASAIVGEQLFGDPHVRMRYTKKELLEKFDVTSIEELEDSREYWNAFFKANEIY